MVQKWPKAEDWSEAQKKRLEHLLNQKPRQQSEPKSNNREPKSR